MRVFVTGASGFIGSAVVTELIGAGHEVVGLARSDAAAEAVAGAGATVRRGALDDLDGLFAGAAESDGVVHMAFRHDIAFSGGFDEAAASELRAIETFGDALAGSDRPLVFASGTAALTPGTVGTERDVPGPDHPLQARIAANAVALALADRGVRPCAVRFPPTVHGPGDHGFIPRLIDTARAKGLSAYVGDGSNRWPAVHRLDAARLCRLAVENAPAGSVLHATAEEGVPAQEIAEAIGRHLGVPVVSIPAEQAVEHFGFVGMIFAADVPASSAATRALMGWQPVHPGLIADLDEGHYFADHSG